MHVKVKLYGTLRRLSQKGSPGCWEGEIPFGMTAMDLVYFLGTTEKEIANASINHIVCPLSQMLYDEDEIILVPNIGGG